MTGAYETLAADYDWMFDDDELAHGRAINGPVTARPLLPSATRVWGTDVPAGYGLGAAGLAA